MSSSEKKKLVISAEDLSDSGESASLAADRSTAPTRELEPDPGRAIEIKPKKGSPKIAPASPPAQTSAVGAPIPTAPQAGPEPWHRKHRRRLVFGGGLFAALALGFVIAFVLLGLFDTGADRTREALTTASGAFENSSADVGKAVQAPLPFTALSEDASASRGRAVTIRETESDFTDKVDEERLVKPTLKALNAERRFLLNFSRIARFPESELMKHWRPLKLQLKASQAHIDASREAVLALNLGDTAHLLPANPKITAMIANSDRIVVAANQKVRSWRAERDAAEEQLAGAESYDGEMAGLMDAYYEQRNETQDLMREPRVPWLVAEETLLAHAAARQGIIESMNALIVPPNAETAHQEMVGLATESKALLEEAADAAREEPYLIWTGTPGWERLHSSSEAITTRFGPAESSVLAAAEAAIASDKAQLAQVGPKPRI